VKKVAVFGGSFDPVHLGHLRIIEAVQKQVQPDRFLIIPCGQPPHREPLIANAEHRRAMLNLAIEDLSEVEVDPRELEREGPSYSYLTLSELGQENPETLLLFVLGWDSLVSLASWMRWQEVMKKSCLLVVGRLGDRRELPEEIDVDVECWPDTEPEAGKIIRLGFEETAISSTEVRRSLKQGKSGHSYLHPSVHRYIEQNNIYSGIVP
jgi:nicotinate-nucleotide adenylyltransferase